MALTCGFYNSIYGDRKYSAIQLSSIFDGIIKDGIFATVGDAFTVSAGSEMQVIVGPGRAWFNHSWTLNDANLPIEVDDAEVVLDRIDAVVIEVNSDDSVRDNTVKMVKGRPSSTPEKPELLDTETVHQYALAYVTVRSGVTEITNADIENAVGTTETPFITGLLETIDATELMNQWNGQFQDWLNEADNSLDNWETQATALQAQWTLEFNDWFEHLQNELDENQAAHLQHQIDELRVKSGMSAKILINSDPGSTVTVTKPDGTVVVATQVLGTTTQWECSTGEYGVHEIVSVLNGEPASKSLNVDTCKIYTIDDDHMHADITVMFPQGFTCRCQGGSENLYATSNPFTFVVHNQTTYTITASAPGITYTETVEITETGQEVNIFCPSVANAPTNDVQMWLFFGGITDKSYTTLSEVLADSTTLMTLINDHNAVDYMVRSKTWITSQGLVPIMTSDNAPSGVASADSVNGTHYAWNAFDGLRGTSWEGATVTGTNRRTGWIQYKFERPTVVRQMELVTYARDSWSNGILYGSNTGGDSASEWTELATFEGEHTGDNYNTDNHRFIGNIDNTTAYLYYRFSCTSYRVGGSSGSSYNYGEPDIRELQFFSMQNIISVPKMTSDTTPSGTVTASSIYSGYDAYAAFDETDQVWSSSNLSAGSECTIEYEFDRDVLITRYDWNGNITQDGSSSWNKSCKIVCQAYVNGSWIDITTPVTLTNNTSSGTNTSPRFDFQTTTLTTPARKYRIRYYNLNATMRCGARHIQFWGTDGNVAITDDSTAMSYIGLNNYASNTLLADCDWLNAICNSAYFESVLNAKVPVMTDNTHPSGEASGSSVYNNRSDLQYWKAFDGLSNTNWASGSNDTVGAYISYKYTSNVKVVKVSVNIANFGTSNSITKFKIQGYVNSNWIDVSDVFTPTNASGDYIFVDDYNSTDYHLIVTEVYNNSSNVGVNELQFYGRIDV